jgi:hypothetical protein
MEKEKEISRLVRVIRQIAFAEKFSGFINQPEDFSEFNVQQFNRVLARLKEIEPSIENLFVELNEGTPSRVIRIAARELAEYFEEDFQPEKDRHGFGHCRKRRFFVGFPPIFDWRCRW